MARKNKAVKKASKTVENDVYIGKPRKHNRKAIQQVNHIAKGHSKIASCYPAGGYGGGGSSFSNDIVTGPNTFYDPYFEPSTLVLPREYLEINAWCRYFYKYDPLVATAIDMHAELPLSKIRLQPPKCKNKDKSQMILKFYEDMVGNEGIDLYNKLLQIGVEYYKLGNVYPYLQLNNDGTKWEKITLLDPDYIVIEKLQYTNAMKVELIPNDRLREIINRGDEDAKTGMLSQTLDPTVKALVTQGSNIPLSTKTTESHVSHLARKMSDYDVYGTSLIERNFKALVYKDRLRRSQDAIAVRHLTPKHLIYTESNANEVDVEAIREQVENAMFDPDYAIITNFQLNWEMVGTNQGLMQLSSEWDWINDELMVGLMINKSFVLGEGAFANGQTILEVLEQRYALYREMLEKWIELHVFRPISVLNKFVEKTKAYVKSSNGKTEIKEVEVYVYPTVKWNRINLTDDNQHKQMLSQMVERGFLDVETWLDYFGLDAEIIMEKMKKYENSQLDPNYQELQRGIQSEVGRVLGPAVAKIRAEEMGLELVSEDEGRFGYAGKENEMLKFGKQSTIKGIEDMPVTSQNLYQTLVNQVTRTILNKMAETREERQRERSLNKVERDRADAVKSLEIDTDNKGMYPERKDIKEKLTKPKMFEGSTEDDLPVVNELDIVSKKKTSMMDIPDNLTFSQNVEREL